LLEVAHDLEERPINFINAVIKTIYQQEAKEKMNNHEEPRNEERQQVNERIPPEEEIITQGDLVRIGKIALILSISLILPGYLYIAGLTLGWALALFVGFIFVAWLGHRIKS
jgi:hypothetical protein